MIPWCREGGSFFSPRLTSRKLLILRCVRHGKSATNAGRGHNLGTRIRLFTLVTAREIDGEPVLDDLDFRVGGRGLHYIVVQLLRSAMHEDSPRGHSLL